LQFNPFCFVINPLPFSMAAYLANEGRKVTIVFETADAFLASPRPLPAFIRKSRHGYIWRVLRLLTVYSGYYPSCLGTLCFDPDWNVFCTLRA
jgi:hypothetical protein